MSQRDALWEENERLLMRLAALAGELTAEDYRADHPDLAGQSVGTHLRHALEHYQAFLRGLAKGRIDYADRPREAALEQDPALAAERVDRIRAELQTAVREAPEELWLVPELSERRAGQGGTLPSGFDRELAFLASHTVHHMALIRLLLAERGIRLEASFGVATATLRDGGEPARKADQAKGESLPCAG